MKNRKLGIYDHEISYADHLMEVLNRKQQNVFEAQVFSKKDNLIQYLGIHSLDVLLINNKLMFSELTCYPISKIILLSEGDMISEFAEFPVVYKYQSSKAIIQEVLKYYADSVENNESYNHTNTKICAIYSPVRRVEHTAFAIALGNAVAKSKNVLYLCLDMFSGIREEFGSDTGKTIADFIYYVNNDAKGLSYLLSSMVENLMGMDWIQPPDSPMDRQDMKLSDWGKVLEVITRQSNYERLIIQLDEGVPEFHQILEYCDIIYMPVSDNPIELNSRKEYEMFLTKAGKETLMEKTKVVKLYNTNNEARCLASLVVEDTMTTVVSNLLSEEDYVKL